ncbi:hypothetical protein ACHAW6_005854 [Cyclotella cf. meneghiniana]
MMYQQFTALLLLSRSTTTIARRLQSDVITCIFANPEDYATCCQDAPDSAVCSYIACEMGVISEGCDCTTLTNFCNSLNTIVDFAVPEICAPSVECCSEGMSDEDFQTCVSEKGGDEIMPTSFFDLNADLVGEEMSMSIPADIENTTEEKTEETIEETTKEPIDETKDAAVAVAKATSSSSRYTSVGPLRAIAVVGLINLVL